MGTTLHLHVPGLLAAAAQAAAHSTPALAYLLGRGTRQTAPRTCRGLAARIFALPDNSAAALPLAALTRLADTGSWEAAYCLRADPVYLHPDRDTLVLVAQPVLTPDETRDLLASLNAHLAENGLALEAPQPQRWYLRLPETPACEFHDLDLVINRSILDYMPAGADASRFKQLQNECQMLLHAHPVNLLRQARGQLPVNGLWLWGGGAFDELQARSFAQVCGRDPLLTGFAMLLGGGAEAEPEDFAGWFAGVVDGEALVSISCLANAEASSALCDFEENWCVPMRLALEQHLLDAVVMYTENLCVRVTRGDLRKFWRRPRPLPAGLT